MTPALSREDVALIESAGKALLRKRENDLGLRVLGLALVLRSQQGWFACDVDESAGLAEIVDLHDFSKKVGA